jgi:hypothetical protein
MRFTSLDGNRVAAIHDEVLADRTVPGGIRDDEDDFSGIAIWRQPDIADVFYDTREDRVLRIGVLHRIMMRL